MTNQPDFRKLLEELADRLPLRFDEGTRNVYTAEEVVDGESYHSWLAECPSPSFGRLAVAAVNALPEHLARIAELEAENERQKALIELQGDVADLASDVLEGKITNDAARKAAAELRARHAALSGGKP
jgi:hypothetical protein